MHHYFKQLLLSCQSSSVKTVLTVGLVNAGIIRKPFPGVSGLITFHASYSVFGCNDRYFASHRNLHAVQLRNGDSNIIIDEAFWAY